MKNEFPCVFSEGLGQCTKTEVRFELNDNIRPIFKAKKYGPFSAVDAVNQEQERLEKMDVISKVNYLDWAAPTVYVKKKNKKDPSLCRPYIPITLTGRYFLKSKWWQNVF